MASGVRAGEASAARGEALQLIEARGQHRGKGRPFADAHGDQVRDGAIQIGDEVSGECGPGRLVGIAFDRLDHTANGENPVERRRRRRHPLAHPLHGGDHIGQHVLVDAYAGRARFMLGGKAGLDVAAGQARGDSLAGRRLDLVEARRHPQADVEALAVDAAHLPGPAIAFP